MSRRLLFVPTLILTLAGPAFAGQAQGQQPPRPIELDAGTIAVRTEAARSLIPLLEDVKEKAKARYQVERGSVPDSPFAGTQTTAVAVTIGRKNAPTDPQVIRAMEQLLEWEPGDRANTEQAALFDAWLAQLSRRASAIATKRGLVSCDTDCVVKTMTALDEGWGSAERQRPENRDQVLLDTFTEAVKSKK